jgi:hypothetical protein
MTELRDRLRDAPLPGEAEAAARSWPVVEAALAEREPGAGGAAAHSRRLALRLALVAALVAIGLVVALTPAGAWIGDRLDDEPQKATPAFAALPPGGSVLAISQSGAYAISPEGDAQRLGSFTDAGWSPHGLHVVGVDGKRLLAVTPLGTIKWTRAQPTRVHHPAWSTLDGFAVAYLAGPALRVIAGDGDPATDRPLRRRAAPVTPAWRPHSDRVLTYATLGGAIETLDVTTGATLWRAPVDARALGWSHSGRRLVALASRSVTVLGREGHVLRTVALPGVARDWALHPSGRRAAVDMGRVVLDVPLDGGRPRPLFQGNVDGLAWSRDGRRLLLGSRDADQWLLLGPGSRIRALDGVSRELGTAGGFPHIAGWCCAG